MRFRRLQLLMLAMSLVVLVAATATVAVAASQRFTDVPPSDWAYDDIEWLAAVGLTNGCEDGTTYCPDDPVSRREIAAFTHRVVNHMHGNRVDIPAAAFVPESDTTVDYRRSWGLTVDASSGQAKPNFHAPVTLPDGAVVTEIKMLVLDNEPDEWVDVVMQRVDKTNVLNSDYVGGVPGSADNSVPAWYSSTSITHPNIDTDQYWYSIIAAIRPGTVLYGVEIHFTMP